MQVEQDAGLVSSSQLSRVNDTSRALSPTIDFKNNLSGEIIGNVQAVNELCKWFTFHLTTLHAGGERKVEVLHERLFKVLSKYKDKVETEQNLRHMPITWTSGNVLYLLLNGKLFQLN